MNLAMGAMREVLILLCCVLVSAAGAADSAGQLLAAVGSGRVQAVRDILADCLSTLPGLLERGVYNCVSSAVFRSPTSDS